MTNDIDTVAERNGRDPANWRFRAENHPRFHADFWRRLHTNDIVFGDSGEDTVKLVEPVEPEPVKRTRKRKVSIPDDHVPELLTLDQAAAYLNITDEQVAAFIADGTLDYINVGRGKKRPRYRFTKQDLDAFIERRRQREVQCLSTSTRSRPFYHFDFQVRGRRFYGSTKCTTRKEAEAFEAVERDKAKALMKAMQRSRTSLLIDDVAARLWDQSAQHDAAPDATSINLARLIEYFGKTKPLTDIDHNEAKRMVAWRRGHHVKGRADAPLISQRDRQPQRHQGSAPPVHLRQVRGRGVRPRTEVGRPVAAGAGRAGARATGRRGGGAR